KKLQVVINLMAVGTRTGRINGVIEQKTAAIPRVTDANRDAREASHPRGVKRVLQQDGGIEALRLKFPAQLPKAVRPAMFTIMLIDDLPIHSGMMPVNFADPGSGDENDLRAREARPQG